jgi:hypothetical protein
VPFVKKAKSLVFTSDQLYACISQEVERVFPFQKLEWKTFSTVIGEQERGGELVMFSSLPPRGRKKGVPTSIFIEGMVGRTVMVRILFPLVGSVFQVDKVIKAFLARSQLVFPVNSGSVVLMISLPFSPVRVKSNGENGNGQKSFICPEEVEAV